MKNKSKFKIGDYVIDSFNNVGEIIDYQWKDHLDMYVYLVGFDYNCQTRELRENELEKL